MVWQVGADHLDVKIDTVVDAMAMLLSTIVGRTPRFRVLHFLVISSWIMQVLKCRTFAM